jgi:hypothetical protein
MRELEADLRTKIKVACWFAINDTIHKSGAREEKVWNESDPRDVELMNVLDSTTIELTNRIMEIIELDKA